MKMNTQNCRKKVQLEHGCMDVTDCPGFWMSDFVFKDFMFEDS